MKKNKDKNKEMNKAQREAPKKKTSWFQNILLGVLIFVAGVLIKFFPSLVTSIGYIVLCVVFVTFGISDCYANLKFKDEKGTWKYGIVAGLSSVLLGGLFACALFFKFALETMLIITAVWALVRCVYLFFVVFTLSASKKSMVAEALLMGFGGVLVLFFRNILIDVAVALGYLCLGAGVVIIFVGFMQRSRENGKLEQKVREELQDKRQAETETPVQAVGAENDSAVPAEQDAQNTDPDQK